MTDCEDNLWFGNYYDWGKLKREMNISGTARQPFQLCITTFSGIMNYGINVVLKHSFQTNLMLCEDIIFTLLGKQYLINRAKNSHNCLCPIS
jgi:RHS family protein